MSVNFKLQAQINNEAREIIKKVNEQNDRFEQLKIIHEITDIDVARAVIMQLIR